MASARIALSPSVTRAAIDSLAIERGWRLANIVPASGAGPRRVVFVTPGAMELITFVLDPGAPAAEIAGHDPQPIEDAVRGALEAARG
jgi:hypothetical protein